MIADFLTHWPMWASLAVVCAAIGFYMSDKWPMELVSVGVLAALLVLFTIPGAH